MIDLGAFLWVCAAIFALEATASFLWGLNAHINVEGRMQVIWNCLIGFANVGLAVMAAHYAGLQ